MQRSFTVKQVLCPIASICRGPGSLFFTMWETLARACSSGERVGWYPPTLIAYPRN